MFTGLSTATPSFVDKWALKCLVLVIFALALYGCKDTNNAPDVSGVKVSLQTQRLDRALASLDTNNLAASVQQLKNEYPDFLTFFLDTLVALGVNDNYTDSNPAINNGLRSYLVHKDYRGVFDTVAKHYPDTKDVDESLEKGFRYMKYYYPSFHEPKVVYLVSWLNNWGAFTYDTTIVGIGLDMFLGPSYPYYKAVGVPEYWSEQLRPAYIPVAVFKALYRDRQPFVMEGRNLLDMMIQRGKEAYFIEKVLPFADKNTRLAYTEKQLQWCERSEAAIYNFFIKQNLLYETNWQKILRYVNEGPSSVGMSDESPGNIGTWMGLQIVKAYVKQHDGITLEQLISNKDDPQQFLLASKYKPR